MNKYLILLCLIILTCRLTFSQQEAQLLTMTSDYLLYLPDGYDVDPDKKWPLLFFLHGAGERGDDVEKVKVHGPPKIVGKKDLPFIIVSPQCPRGEWWDPFVLNRLYDKIVGEHQVDLDRVYLTGLSMGGFGTWDWAAENPEKFAAIAPICGGGNPNNVWKIRHIPTWVFHGDSDVVVPLQMSDVMVEGMKAMDADVQFTVYPNVGHDSWTETYDNEKLYEWFLSHSRKKLPQVTVEASILKTYVGDYEHPEIGTINVAYEQDKLWVKTARQKRPLVPESPDRFRVVLLGQSLVSFFEEGMTIYMDGRIETAPKVK